MHWDCRLIISLLSPTRCNKRSTLPVDIRFQSQLGRSRRIVLLFPLRGLHKAQTSLYSDKIREISVLSPDFVDRQESFQPLILCVKRCCVRSLYFEDTPKVTTVYLPYYLLGDAGTSKEGEVMGNQKCEPNNQHTTNTTAMTKTCSKILYIGQNIIARHTQYESKIQPR
jgi:hypothetical protein